MNTRPLPAAPVVEDAAVMNATGRDHAAILDVLVRAFESDPGARWWFSRPGGYRGGFAAFAAALGGRAFDAGAASYVAGFRGAALWLPPGVKPDEEALAAVIECHVPAARARTVAALMDEMGRRHPDRPHWYLPLIGVDPAHQRKGLGSALLRDAAARLDRARQVAYLEASNAVNVPLYRRHGFEPAGVIQVGDAPPVYPMVREPG